MIAKLDANERHGQPRLEAERTSSETPYSRRAIVDRALAQADQALAQAVKCLEHADYAQSIAQARKCIEVAGVLFASVRRDLGVLARSRDR